MRELDGLVALVTGATSGIGRETAKQLAERGAKVVGAGRRQELGDQLVEEIGQAGGEAIFVATDISDEGQVKALVDKAVNQYGGLDICVNNAGTEGKMKPIIEMNSSDFESVIRTNLMGVWFCLKYQIPILMKRGGSIINISSIAVGRGFANTGAYSASKGGVESLSHVAAVEYAKHGVRVNVIRPGSIETAMAHRAFSDEMIQEAVRQIPSQKIGMPADVAHTVCYLASPGAKHVNGTTITVDGGQILP